MINLIAEGISSDIYGETDVDAFFLELIIGGAALFAGVARANLKSAGGFENDASFCEAVT